MPSSLRLDKQLQDAARLGSLVDVDAALTYGADPNYRDDSGYRRCSMLRKETFPRASAGWSRMVQT